FRARDVRGERGCAAYTLECLAGRAEIRMRSPGLHLVDDGLCAAAAAFASGALGARPLEAIARGLEAFAGVPGRVALLETAAGVRVLDDRYNANPHSVPQGLETLAELRASGRTIAVLGDMFELGPEEAALHAGVGRAAAANGVDVLVAVGPLSQHTARAAREAGVARVLEADGAEAAAAHVRAVAKPGDVVLIKASHGMKLERVVQILRET